MPAHAADLDAEILAEDEPEIVEILIPGTDHSEEIAAVQLQIKDLDALDDDYDERHPQLVAELRRLRALRIEPEQRTAVYTHPMPQ